jgi:hypothetical protein
MEAIRSSETSVYPSSTQRHIPEDSILLKKLLTDIQNKRRGVFFHDNALPLLALDNAAAFQLGVV